MRPAAGVEFPAGLVVDQGNRERKVVRAQDQRRLLVSLRLDRMLGVIRGQETLARLGVGDVVAGLDDVVGAPCREPSEWRSVVPLLTAAASAAAASSGEG